MQPLAFHTFHHLSGDRHNFSSGLIDETLEDFYGFVVSLGVQNAKTSK